MVHQQTTKSVLITNKPQSPFSSPCPPSSEYLHNHTVDSFLTTHHLLNHHLPNKYDNHNSNHSSCSSDEVFSPSNSSFCSRKHSINVHTEIFCPFIVPLSNRKTKSKTSFVSFRKFPFIPQPQPQPSNQLHTTITIQSTNSTSQQRNQLLRKRESETNFDNNVAFHGFEALHDDDPTSHETKTAPPNHPNPDPRSRHSSTKPTIFKKLDRHRSSFTQTKRRAKVYFLSKRR